MPDELHQRPMFGATRLRQGARLVPCHTDPIGAKGCAASSSSTLFYRLITGEGAWPLVVHQYRQALPGESWEAYRHLCSHRPGQAGIGSLAAYPGRP
jgi:hypothetical protein